MIIEIAFDSTLERSVESFDLSVCFWMVRRRKLILKVQYPADILKELGGEAISII